MANKPSMLDVFERNKYDLLTSVKRSRTWFDQQVLLMSKQRITPQQVLAGNTTQNTTRVIPGHLYMFVYDPKTKNDLPYYDKFPLVFPFGKTENGFMGLNMHYLPYSLRITLLDRLLIYVNNAKIDETTKIKYSWKLIDGVARYKMAEPCVKRYITGNVRSVFRQVNSKDWATAMLLPVERFVGASKQEVWGDSRRAANS